MCLPIPNTAIRRGLFALRGHNCLIGADGRGIAVQLGADSGKVDQHGPLGAVHIEESPREDRRASAVNQTFDAGTAGIDVGGQLISSFRVCLFVLTQVIYNDLSVNEKIQGDAKSVRTFVSGRTAMRTRSKERL